jgi:hypothetical protein
MQNFLNQILCWRVNEVLKTCPRKRFQLANFVKPNTQTVSTKAFQVAACVKLKMNVLVGIANQKAKICQTEPT